MKIEDKWPVKDWSKIQLYTLGTPNGLKVNIALEEMGLPYEAHIVNFGTNDQKSEEFLSINPNGKIPTIIDPDGPGGERHVMMESGAILLHLADKSGKLIPQDPALRSECIQWLFFQVGHIGPMFGQFGHFYKFAGEKCDHPYPTERYKDETRRLLGILEQRLEGRTWLMGDQYTIADIAIFPWCGTLSGFYEAGEILGLSDFPKVTDWVKRCTERPATARGRAIGE